ncbi:hypothetical protein MLD38_040622 [Melastoma candidum]|nr:hypothetical protein MLD38_040622 [Melastoma candidum]
MLAQVESEAVLTAVNEFYSLEMLPEIAKFLDPSRPPWKDWVEKLDEHTPIPESQLDEVRNAWRSWKEAFVDCRSAAASAL